MTTARDIMTAGAEYAQTTETVTQAAVRLASMVTDRDIVVEVVAAGKDPKVPQLSELVTAEPVVTVAADASVDEAIETMKRHQVRRVPVIDGYDVVGILSQGDIARALAPAQAGELLAGLSA